MLTTVALFILFIEEGTPSIVIMQVYDLEDSSMELHTFPYLGVCIKQYHLAPNIHLPIQPHHVHQK